MNNYDEEIIANKMIVSFFFALFALLLTYSSIDAWSRSSPLLTLLGYGNWFFPNDHSPLLKYLLSRPWHLIPFIAILVSVFAVIKILITGKCKYFKGITLSLLIEINIAITAIFIIPMCIEMLIMAALLFLPICVLYKLYEVVELRFNKSCKCE